MAVALLLLAIAPAAEAGPPFGISSFTSHTADELGADYTAAGGHPFLNRTLFDFPHDQGGGPVELLKDAAVTFPPGFLGNPAALPRCPIGKIHDANFETPGDPTSLTECPPGSRVGTALLASGTPLPGLEEPIYNLVTERGHPAQFGFVATGFITILSVAPLPRSESYGLTIGSKSIPQISNAWSVETTLCGYGAQESPGLSRCKAPSESTGAPFLSNPIDCSEAQPTWKLAADSWPHAGTYLPNGFPDLSNPGWKTASFTSPPVTGCDNPLLASQFNSTTIATKPLQPGGGPVQADQPAGLQVDLDFPQSNDPTDLNTEAEPDTPQAPEPKDIIVKLPAGLSISPSSADGLQACSDLASGPAGDQVHYDDTKPVRCPDASKIGSAVAITPLLALHDPQDDHIVGPEPIPGDIYLLKPHPGDLSQSGDQDGTFRLLIQLENPGAGINFKLPGVAVADRQTGQLTATFTDNPQLPARHLQLTLKGGPNAWLATPVTCGKFATTSTLVPWSTPGTPDAHPSASFEVGSDPGGSGCPANAAARPFAPTLIAGNESTKAGAGTPFVMKLTRADGEQELSSFDLTMPPGFSAKLAGVPYCSEAAIAAAASRSGAAEQASPSCPAASQIGTLAAGTGPGPNPYQVSGKAYLSGPYKGAPISFVFIVPATAGPFDLGNIVVRAAILVDPETAQMTVRSDPLPR
ncbi:MAG TPA: hypothetical protein VGQ28_04465, partial [Thermoanaerobaculia bacterium]|nr:hypothetical protein [Thermoanaerobaculia bacterium]